MSNSFTFDEDEIVRDEFTRDSAHRALSEAVRRAEELRMSPVSRANREEYDEVVERIDYLQRVCSEIDSHPEARRNPRYFRMYFPRRVRTRRGVQMHGTMTGRFSSREPLRSVADLRARAVEVERERQNAAMYESAMQDVRIELPNFEELERRILGSFAAEAAKEKEPELKGLWPAKSPLLKKAACA